MIIVLRVVALLGLGAVAFCAIAWLRTRDPAWIRRGVRMLLVSLGIAFVFFGVLIFERLQAVPSP